MMNNALFLIISANIFNIYSENIKNFFLNLYRLDLLNLKYIKL